MLNVIVAAALTIAFRAVRAPEGVDGTEPVDYWSEQASPDVLAEAAREVSGAEASDGRRG